MRGRILSTLHGQYRADRQADSLPALPSPVRANVPRRREPSIARIPSLVAAMVVPSPVLGPPEAHQLHSKILGTGALPHHWVPSLAARLRCELLAEPILAVSTAKLAGPAARFARTPKTPSRAPGSLFSMSRRWPRC